MEPDGRALLLVQRDLDADERGRRNQRRLRATVYAGGRSEPLRDAVLYLCFGGRQYSDNPRAIHEELVRRDAPLEHLWAVRDGRCRPPASCEALRAGSREYLEALARARFVVANDHFPVWFERRPDQTCLQTWHGTPLKRLGFDAPSLRVEGRRFARRWESQQDNWQYVLSPNSFSTPIMRSAFAITGELLELGYPRNDRLAAGGASSGAPCGGARAGRRRTRGAVRADLSRPGARPRRPLPARAGARRGAPARRARPRHRRPVPQAPLRRRPRPRDPDGLVRDVSGWPDATELLAAADVLVTDYSSLMFDFAITGRPMLFFTYDLERYRDEIRGFYFDFEAVAPGPLLRTTDELAGALGELDAVVSEHSAAYRRFAAAFCELDDGDASARVVDRVFGLPSQLGTPLSQRAHA